MADVRGAIAKFARLESASGLLLLAALAAALGWSNSPWADAYFRILGWEAGFGSGAFAYHATVQHLINDGLMAVFFFVVGLEIKREMLVGELSGLGRAALPLGAALGGMAVPALLYAAFNHGLPSARGWGIPMATDIPFALGILALLGRRIPNPIRIFLMALAIIDDLGAVLVIALFYTREISWGALGCAAGVVALMIACNRAGFRRPAVYLLPAIVLWYLIQRSGVHATIAGVMAAWTIPANPDPARAGTEPPLQRLEAILHPWTVFLILPVFALANAGIRFDPSLLVALAEPTGLGILAGLVIGKPLGIFGAARILITMGLPPLSGGVTWKHLLGAGMLGGIGFTMSIFIAGLAFAPGRDLDGAKLAIFTASAAAGLAGWAFLRALKVPGKG